MSMFTLYLFVMLDNIGVLSVIFSFVLAVAFLILIICLEDAIGEEYKNKIKSLMKKVFAFAIFFILMATLLPNTKQMAFIYIVSNLSQNKQVKGIGEKAIQIPDKALEVLNLKLDEYMKEMRGDLRK